MSTDSVLYEIFAGAIQAPEELKKVIESFELVEYSKGTLLLKEGQTANTYYFVESGFLRTFAIDTYGNDITTGFYSKGQIVWEVASLFLQTPTKENLEALEDVSLWQINLQKFQMLFDNIADFREAGRTRLVQNHVQLKQRSLALITDSAESRYRSLMHQNPEILQQAPLKYIASYLGITDTSLSRIRKEISNS